MYHTESKKIRDLLVKNISSFKGGTLFAIGDVTVNITGKDGIGGLIEEWFGVWAEEKGFNITDPKKNSGSQMFPDYYVGTDNSLLEVKTFDATASANFDLANFDSYCESVAEFPQRVDADYLIFSYKLEDDELTIENVWLKKIWEITCPSDAYPLKIQQKRGVIYKIRPAAWYSSRSQFHTFKSKDEFIEALYDTQEEYCGKGGANKEKYRSNLG